MVQRICQRCGASSAMGAVTAEPKGWAVATCPRCGHRHRFRHLPLFVLTGASGTGKTTTCELLQHTLPECIVLDSDVLLAALKSFAASDVQRYWDQWLRLILQIHQAGKPVLVCGTVLPHHLESAPDRDGIAVIHYLALVCEESELERRLRVRPAWRGCDTAFIVEHVRFDRWWRDRDGEENARVELLDTTGGTPLGTAGSVRAWVHQRL